MTEKMQPQDIFYFIVGSDETPTFVNQLLMGDAATLKGLRKEENGSAKFKTAKGQVNIFWGAQAHALATIQANNLE
jgi:hypothetical protein